MLWVNIGEACSKMLQYGVLPDQHSTRSILFPPPLTVNEHSIAMEHAQSSSGFVFAAPRPV